MVSFKLLDHFQTVTLLQSTGNGPYSDEAPGWSTLLKRDNILEITLYWPFVVGSNKGGCSPGISKPIEHHWLSPTEKVETRLRMLALWQAGMFRATLYAPRPS